MMEMPSCPYCLSSLYYIIHGYISYANLSSVPPSRCKGSLPEIQGEERSRPDGLCITSHVFLRNVETKNVAGAESSALSTKLRLKGHLPAMPLSILSEVMAENDVNAIMPKAVADLKGYIVIQIWGRESSFQWRQRTP
jgi:hypothetical protein